MQSPRGTRYIHANLEVTWFIQIGTYSLRDTRSTLKEYKEFNPCLLGLRHMGT